MDEEFKPGRCIHDTGDALRLDSVFECPYCGHQAMLNDFDCLDAEDGNVFCNHCLGEFRPAIPMKQTELSFDAVKPKRRKRTSVK